jgi:hypothetical protein
MVAQPNTRQWYPVTRREKCRICERPDWCTWTIEGRGGSCCMRVMSGTPMRNGGWFHPFGGPAPISPPASREKLVPERPDCSAIMRGWRARTTPDMMAGIAATLSLSPQSLEWLGAAWAPEKMAVAFPMFDETAGTIDQPCGVRLRAEDGRKFAVTGSKSGIFIPFGALLKISCRRIFVCEGPTDTGACLEIGCFAIGRASCRGGEAIVRACLDQLCPDEVVVVSDNDGPGILGADHLMTTLPMQRVKLTTPCKDMRKFVQAGGTSQVLDSMLRNLIREKRKFA